MKPNEPPHPDCDESCRYHCEMQAGVSPTPPAQSEVPTPETDKEYFGWPKDARPTSLCRDLERRLAASELRASDYDFDRHTLRERLAAMTAERDEARQLAISNAELVQNKQMFLESAWAERDQLRADLAAAQAACADRESLLRQLRSDYDHAWPNETSEDERYRAIVMSRIDTALANPTGSAFLAKLERYRVALRPFAALDPCDE